MTNEEAYKMIVERAEQLVHNAIAEMVTAQNQMYWNDMVFSELDYWGVLTGGVNDERFLLQ